MRDAHRLPLGRYMAAWTLAASIGFAAGCGGDEASASKESATPAEGAKTEGATETQGGAENTDKADGKAGQGDKPSKSRSSKDKSSKSDSAKSDDTKPAATGDKIGIAACDDYLKTVHDCGDKKVIEMAEDRLAKKWREMLANGKSESDVAPLCEKAAGLFKCKK